MIMEIYDKDENPLDPDDFIGRCVVSLKDANISMKDEVPRPKWHACRFTNNPKEPPSGEVLVSFNIVEDDFKFAHPSQYMDLEAEVNFEDYNVELNVLGLRDLQSAGLLPIKKAFITFQMSTLVPATSAKKLQDIHTVPGPTGKDPTINTIIKTKLPLPGDPLFCPRLSCQVHDMIFKGFSQPMIGTFVVPIGDIMHDQKNDMN